MEAKYSKTDSPFELYSDRRVGILLKLFKPRVGAYMQKKNEQTMRRIFDSAEVLFSTKEFLDVKMEDIANGANVGKGTIYTYFKSKEELLFKCLINNLDEDQQQMGEFLKSSASFEEKLLVIFNRMYEFMKKKGPMLQQYMKIGHKYKMSSADHKFLHEKFENGLNMLSVFFQKGIDEGILADAMTARQLAIIFQKIFDFNVIFNFYGEPEMSAEDACELFKKTFYKNRSNK